MLTALLWSLRLLRGPGSKPCSQGSEASMPEAFRKAEGRGLDLAPSLGNKDFSSAICVAGHMPLHFLSYNTCVAGHVPLSCRPRTSFGQS